MAQSLSDSSVFTEGSIPRHVIRMTLTSTIGLIGIFLVDFIDMYFLSLLGHAELAAAVGFAGSVTFFTTSFCIGIAVATGIVLARLMGQQRYTDARKAFGVAMIFTSVITIIVALLIFPFTDELLLALGAEGMTGIYAEQYLQIVVPSVPFLGLAMCASAALRGVGAAQAAMYCTLGGSLINGVLDPIFIFYFELGVRGAAIASAISVVSMFVIGIWLLITRYQFFAPINASDIKRDTKILTPLAIPAILTNFATPVANAYVVREMAPFGDEAVSGLSIIGRLVPVAFAIAFALSGAVGPIIGQNLGAGLTPRIRKTLNFSFLFITLYTLVTWALLNLGADLIADIFKAQGQSRALILLFCDYLCLGMMFVGYTYIGNAFFNNIGKPHYSTMLNWGKATIGTIPFVYYGGMYFGDNGLLAGQYLGHVIFGLLSYVLVLLFMKHCNKPC